MLSEGYWKAASAQTHCGEIALDEGLVGATEVHRAAKELG